MTDGLSRRDLVAVIGAGMAISACTGGHEIRTCGNEGLNAHAGPPKDKYYPKEFACEHLAILCIGLGTDWALSVTHANFDLKEEERKEDLREEKALSILAAAWAGGARKPFQDNPDALKPRKRNDTKNYDEHSDFEKFKFNKPIELFIYIHQDGLKTDERTKLVIDDDRLITFGPYMQERDNQNYPIKAVPNCSYFNASIVDIGAYTQLNRCGRLMKVKNWSRNIDGHNLPADKSNILHSMNIHFLLPFGSAGTLLPMVFDPDTGNGTGNEP